MSQADAQRRVQAAMIDSDALSPEGSASVQNWGGTAYVAIPRRLVQHYEIEQGDRLQRAYDPKTGCLTISLGDHDLFE
ncbi:hypothetical protein [Halapricum hydrolyticum]|uniref:Uncharacterized protein n=1 Tax=Halapricum hydrolyticum TaxID=2979991 RepID=A0AAE3LDR9_9EURY|nr:hypothetical protein [Halapricum hydrolyticum]MCU4716874.1 hypothetical protein [Halapricum hydrolyticum]MCU4725521.1 hypothetical protein [Halapricum hydrolyticum]